MVHLLDFIINLNFFNPVSSVMVEASNDLLSPISSCLLAKKGLSKDTSSSMIIEIAVGFALLIDFVFERINQVVYDVVHVLILFLKWRSSIWHLNMSKLKIFFDTSCDIAFWRFLKSCYQSDSWYLIPVVTLPQWNPHYGVSFVAMLFVGFKYLKSLVKNMILITIPTWNRATGKICRRNDAPYRYLPWLTWL